MLLRAENLDILTIARRLGHESTKSTKIYLRADGRLKQPAIERIGRGDYTSSDTVLAFLDRL
jgi:integrase